MVKQKSFNKFSKIISLILSVAMIFGAFQVTAFAETITQGLWTINNEASSGTATYGDIGFTYHSPTTQLTYGLSGKDYVRSTNTNGSASNGIVATEGKSYADFTAKTDGTLTVYVGNAATKTGYASKTTANGKSSAIGSFIPGGNGDYNNKETGFEVIQGKSWATVNMEVEEGATYYITLSGSKMFCYGAEFVPYTTVSGTISDTTGAFTETDYSVKFINRTTGDIKNVDVKDNKYSATLKPNYEYSVAFAGSLASNFAFSSATKFINVEATETATQTANLSIEKSISYVVKGSITGVTDDYDTSDMKLVFVPEDTASFENVQAELNENASAYTAQLVAGQKYTLNLKGAYDYELAEKIEVNYTPKTDDKDDTDSPVLGNPDGDNVISVNDAVVTLNYVLNASTANDTNAIVDRMDMNKDGYVTAIDVSMILQKALESISSGDDEKPENDEITKDVTLSPVTTYDVNGKFIGLTQVRGKYQDLDVAPTELTLKNIDDGYKYNATISNGSYSLKLRNGKYIASITSDNYSTSTHVIVDNNATTRDLLFKDLSKKEVAYTDTLYVGSDKEYKTVQSAVDAATNMTRTDGQSVTIKIDPGTYREQVYVDTPNITFESNGGTRDNTKITWYYGIGYKYYSCVNSLYDPYADYDKFEKGNAVSYWGSAVITRVNATGFKAKNITFENSFNKYLTDEEFTDGVELNGLTGITEVRKESTNVDTRNATERAAALVNYADKTEFLNCSFIGSQDTLYTSNDTTDAYYKNCYIEGQTDFIYGNGDVIFDGCEINFCGYDGTKASGYITANSSDDAHLAEDGYIFRSCYISYNGERDVTAGYLGRMWGNSAKVAFVNTQLQQSDMIMNEGWFSMTVAPTDERVTLKEYNTTYNGTKIDLSGRVNGAVDSINSDDYSVEKVFIEKGWTPTYYTTDSNNTPSFTTEPAMTSNGDLNTPNPGETITLSYALGDEWQGQDASRISWYAVDTDFDNTSLETILQKATLLKTTSAISSHTFQIPMECAGKYIMAVVTPITNNGLTGEAKYIIDTEKPVSSTWSNPSNPDDIAPGSGINIYLAGDSTVKDYSAKGIYNGGRILGEGAWGEYLQDFFDSKYVTVNNYAQGGRSSRSFLNEGKLDTIIKNIKAGDYLFIQFGHNDCANGKSYYEERYAPLITKDAQKTDSGYPTVLPTEDLKVTTPSNLVSAYGDKYYSWDCGATYKGYIQEYINRALEKGAIPVVVSPVARLYYTSDGKIRTHHDATMTDYEPTIAYNTTNNAYVTACEELYNENKDKGVLYLDAYGLTSSLYEKAYKDGGNDTYGRAIMANGDSTHSNKTGGVIQAGLIAKWAKDAGISISDYVVEPTTVYGETPSGDYIFTIKNSLFEAKDNSYVKSDYWTNYGQALFDSLDKKSDDTTKNVTFDFSTEDAIALYKTNADTTFVDGVYSGVYTNDSREKFDVDVYKDGVVYDESKTSDGIQAVAGKKIFALKVSDEGVYKITTTATGEGSLGMYSISDLTELVSTASEDSNTIKYAKKTAGEETIYVAATTANDMFISKISISKEELPEEVPNDVTLNFATDDALKLYETDADTTFVDGVYSGVYTNANEQKFETSVYKSGVQYINSTVQYGTKATPNKPIFSFKAKSQEVYTVKATASTGSGTIGLFTDEACQNPVVTTSSDNAIVYKKTTADEETLYFATTDAGNMYLKEITISSYVPKNVILDFSNAEIAKVYIDDSSYTDGAYTGVYTNENNQEFDAEVYRKAIQYLGSGDSINPQYGTKLNSVKVPLFSFVAPEKGMYTITTSLGAGSGTLSLFTDKDCTNEVATGDAGSTVVYKKATSEPETLYLAPTAISNLYLKTATIKKEELPADIKTVFSGNVTGIESDDTNVVITLKGTTENHTITADEYTNTGLELIQGETYVITAKGDKGVYIGTDLVPDDSGTADIVLSRLIFDFPLDFVENYDDYKTYLDLMNYSGDITDAYSGITVHANGIVQTDSFRKYGVKTNSNDIISFKASQTGTCNVTVGVSVSGSDTIALKVNGEIKSDTVTAVQGEDAVISVAVNEGDVVTIHTPTRSNLWYKAINVAYE